MERKLPKVSVTLRPELLVDLDYLTARLGVSRSSLISELLSDVVPDMRRLIEAVPLSPEPPDLVRFRGESADLVRERMENLKALDADLFAVIQGGGVKDA